MSNSLELLTELLKYSNDDINRMINEATNEDWQLITAIHWIILLKRYPYIQRVNWIKFDEVMWDFLERQQPILREFVHKNKKQYLMMHSITSED